MSQVRKPLKKKKFTSLNTLKVKKLGYGKICKILSESIKKTQMIHRKTQIHRIIKNINANRCNLFVQTSNNKNTDNIQC